MYKREGHEMFRNLQDKIQSDIARTMFRPGIGINGSESNPPTHSNTSKAKAPRTIPAPVIAQKRTGGTTLKSAKVGRNEKCPCGSGKKFKRCCGHAA